tara:strand:- start:883 stop:1296 length:414 start_codon:yes stop_codon:yes gene_type:complete
MKTKLGDFLSAINLSKKNLMEEDPFAEKDYVPFVINRTMSYFSDTILYANELNLRGHLDNRLQNDYLLNSIRRKKRFSRWLKPDVNGDIDAIKEYYSCSYRKAHEIVKVLSDDELSLVHNRLKRGGIKNGRTRSGRT